MISIRPTAGATRKQSVSRAVEIWQRNVNMQYVPTGSMESWYPKGKNHGDLLEKGGDPGRRLVRRGQCYGLTI